MATGHLHLTINAEKVELDALMPSGFSVKVGGSMDALLPLLVPLWEELKQSVKKEKFEGILKNGIGRG